MLRFHRLMITQAMIACLLCGCSKDERPKSYPDPRIDFISGVYKGWYMSASSSTQYPDSVATEIVIKRASDRSFIVVHGKQDYPYPKEFAFKNYKYTFFSDGGYKHTLVLDTAGRKLALTTTIEDPNGSYWGIRRFLGTK